MLMPTLPAPVVVIVPLLTMSSPSMPAIAVVPALPVDSAPLLVIGS